MPGVRGVNHIGLTSPDMTEGSEASSLDVLGLREANIVWALSDDTGPSMQDLLDVDPRAVVNEITLMRCWLGSNIDCSPLTSAGQKTVRRSPRTAILAGPTTSLSTSDDIDCRRRPYFKDIGNSAH